MKDLFVEFAYAQLPKWGEELCGDSVSYDKGYWPGLMVWVVE